MTSQAAPAVDAALADKIANTIRFLSADGVEAAKSGHPGLPMGCADIATVLLTRFLRLDPDDPKWNNRDRFVLSAGHGSMLLYSMLHLAGFMPLEELKRFRQLGSKTPGHPEYGYTPGVDFTGGPLGAGFAASVGMALAREVAAEMYNTPHYEIVDHFTYVLMGDGCQQEGITQEAASLAGHLKLGRLIAIYDDNGIQIDGPTSLAFSEDVGARYEAMNWHVQRIDGHDHDAIAQAIEAAQQERTRPSLIMARTTIGKGAPEKAGTHKVHGAPLGEEEILAGKKAIGWPEEPFHVPPEVNAHFEQRRDEWRKRRAEWDKLFKQFEEAHTKTLAREYHRTMSGELPKQWKHAMPEFGPDVTDATRSSGGKVLDAFAEILPELLGGAADLAESTKTVITSGKYTEDVAPGMFLGRNIHFGVREHAMGQMTNGIAAYGGFIPYCSTFLVFHDYQRPALRMAALMKLRSIFVYTHDSIFVGEDGPTHQPVEQIAALRCIPNLDVFRPCDANETAWAWQYALARTEGPTAICLSRQKLPAFDRTQYAAAKDTLKGGYILELDPEGQAEICLIASGSEVHLAHEIATILREAGRTVRVVSMPSLDVFKKQSDGYRKKVLPKRFKNRVVIEAGVSQGWEGILGDKGIFIGMDDFGASGPCKDLEKHFGFNADAIIDKLAEADF